MNHRQKVSVQTGVWSKRRQVRTATSQNGDKPKRLQVQSKRINLLSSTVDLFSELLTKFQLIQLCVFTVQSLVSKISWAQICFALSQALRAMEYCTSFIYMPYMCTAYGRLYRLH